MQEQEYSRQKLVELQNNGEITQLKIGIHGLIFMAIKGGYLQTYDNYRDAYSHYIYYKNKK